MSTKIIPAKRDARLRAGSRSFWLATLAGVGLSLGLASLASAQPGGVGPVPPGGVGPLPPGGVGPFPPGGVGPLPPGGMGGFPPGGVGPGGVGVGVGVGPGGVGIGVNVGGVGGVGGVNFDAYQNPGPYAFMQPVQVYRPLDKWYYYPYYYFPHSYWPNMGPKWPERPGEHTLPAPAYMSYPPFHEPHWRYEAWEQQRYYRGFHFLLDQF